MSTAATAWPFESGRCRAGEVIGRDLGAAQALPTAHSSADRQWPGIHRLRLVGVECRDRFHMAYIPPSSPEELMR